MYIVMDGWVGGKRGQLHWVTYCEIVNVNRKSVEIVSWWIGVGHADADDGGSDRMGQWSEFEWRKVMMVMNSTRSVGRRRRKIVMQPRHDISPTRSSRRRDPGGVAYRAQII